MTRVKTFADAGTFTEDDLNAIQQDAFDAVSWRRVLQLTRGDRTAPAHHASRFWTPNSPQQLSTRNNAAGDSWNYSPYYAMSLRYLDSTPRTRYKLVTWITVSKAVEYSVVAWLARMTSWRLLPIIDELVPTFEILDESAVLTPASSLSTIDGPVASSTIFRVPSPGFYGILAMPTANMPTGGVFEITADLWQIERLP